MSERFSLAPNPTPYRTLTKTQTDTYRIFIRHLGADERAIAKLGRKEMAEQSVIFAELFDKHMRNHFVVIPRAKLAVGFLAYFGRLN